jgi:hypothetical protein
MARKPLRSQLNQIRSWVRQGRTDAWIAHQLEVSTSELREFRRRHDLAPGEEGFDDADLRDEIEAEIEATMSEEEEEEGEEGEEDEEADADEAAAEAPAAEAGGGRRRRRRRRRRRAPAALQATFEHGDNEGYGLWLDPSVEDDPTYAENWAGHRQVEVTIEPDRIVIRRAGDEGSEGSEPSS